MRFAVYSAGGVTLKLCEHIEDALETMRRIDSAESIVRIVDGEMLATKTRFGRMRPLPVAVLS